ncbi:hypothetical protein IJ182_01535 [bacterium]|nr:hypothetical protein [bacterium]
MVQKTTRNEAFNGYFFDDVKTEKTFYSSLNTITTSKAKTITKQAVSNLKLLDVTDYTVTTGESIINDAAANKTLIDLGYSAKLDYSGYLNKEQDYYIFGSPYKMSLANRQNYNNCGVESTLNTLIMAGKMTIGNEKKTEKTFLSNIMSLGLCDDDGEIGILDESDGGTLPYNYKAILDLYGIESETYYSKTDESIELSGKQFEDEGLKKLGYKISQGYGAVLGVCSSILWQEKKSETGDRDIDHAITVLGVVYDTKTPNETTSPVGFFIQDTGAWMTRFISTEELISATLYKEYCDGLTPEDENYNKELKGKTGEGLYITITSEPIKDATNNINATGDKFDNTLLGNSGNNIIKGMAGNDLLYGGNGNDTIYGGAGNDTIYGNGGIAEDSYMYGLADDNEKKFIGINSLNGGDGKDVIYGGNSSDYIFGGNGNDTLYGNAGIDVLYGGKGNDEIHGGSSTDKILGEAGNDIIFGDDGDDTINGGTGNDTIYGGAGNDRIECGKGNDTIIIEGKKHGIDMISSSSGNTTIKFTEKDGEKLSIDDLYFEIENDEEKPNMTNIQIAYTDDEDNIEDGIEFDYLFNSKKNTNKNLTIEDGNNEKYRVSISKSTKATVADTSTKKGHDDINNILFTTNLKNKTIKTSTKNDIVYMMETTSELYSEKDYNRVDTITYTGGYDKYYSHAGDTSYIVNFDNSANLQIFDNINLIKTQIIDVETFELKDYTVEASKNDEIKFSTDFNSLSFLFDVTTDKKVSDNTNLFALYNDDNLYNRISNIISGEKTNGIVTINDFFKEGKSLEQQDDKYDFYGNGNIEKIYTKNDTGYALYENINTDIAQIASSVASWLDGKGYSSAFDAIENITDTEVLKTLIQCYSVA